jgi:hypothetical protein
MYIILGVASLALLILVLLNKNKILFEALIWMVSIIFMLIVASIHGIIAHSLYPKIKGTLIFYPILMGILFGIITCIFIFLVLPYVWTYGS